jgi:hypothetical protein
MKVYFCDNNAVAVVRYFECFPVSHLHLLLRGVVHEGETLVNEPKSVALELGKIIRRVRDDVGKDPELLQILDDTLLELLLLLRGVRVVEPAAKGSVGECELDTRGKNGLPLSTTQFLPHNQPPLVSPCVVVVQEHSLGVSDVKVSARLRWEACTHLERHGALEELAAGGEGIEDLVRGELSGAVDRAEEVAGF